MITINPLKALTFRCLVGCVTAAIGLAAAPLFATAPAPGQLPRLWNFTQGMQGWSCGDLTSGSARPDGLHLLATAAAPSIFTRVQSLPPGRYAATLNGDFSDCRKVRLFWRGPSVKDWDPAESVVVAPSADEPDAIDLPFAAATAVGSIRVEFICGTPGATVFLSGASLHLPAGA